jgi:hypothetical protein
MKSRLFLFALIPHSGLELGFERSYPYRPAMNFLFVWHPNPPRQIWTEHNLPRNSERRGTGYLLNFRLAIAML